MIFHLTGYCKALAKLLNKVRLKAPTLLDPTLFDRLAAHVGRCSSNIFCSIKGWIEFAFDQTLQPIILLDAKMLQCFAALSTKLCPESSHVRAASQSRITISFSSLQSVTQCWYTDGINRVSLPLPPFNVA